MTNIVIVFMRVLSWSVALTHVVLRLPVLHNTDQGRFEGLNLLPLEALILKCTVLVQMRSIQQLRVRSVLGLIQRLTAQLYCLKATTVRQNRRMLGVLALIIADPRRLHIILLKHRVLEMSIKLCSLRHRSLWMFGGRVEVVQHTSEMIGVLVPNDDLGSFLV